MTPDQCSIGIVAYGDHPSILSRCVESIIKTLHPYVPKIILGLNHIGPASRNWVNSVRPWFDTVIDSSSNIYVEGMLALILQACRTEVLVRLDDDSHVLDPGWWPVLMRELSALPRRWGGLGRLHQFSQYGDGRPVQGMVSRDWVRQQPWYRSDQDGLLQQPATGISGGFCALNVKACLAVGYPSDESPVFEEDAIMSLQLRMNDYSLHDSVLIHELSLGSLKLGGRKPLIAIGDCESRTNRSVARGKWKGKFPVN